MRLLLVLALAAPLHAADPGEVVLVGGTGEACPAEHLGAGALVLLLDGAALPAPLGERPTLDLHAEGPAPTRADLARLRTASALHLVGDSGLGWWKAMNDHGRRSSLQRAVHDARARGVALVGWRAGAEYLAGAWLAPAGELEASGFRPRNPRRDLPERAASGLGLAPGGLLVRGEDALARALAALHRRHAWTALLLEGEVAWCWAPARREVSVSGTGRVLLVEMDGARRTRRGFDGAALSALRAGDVWDTHLDRLTLEDARSSGPVHLDVAAPKLAEARGARLALHVTGLAPWPPGIR